MTTTFYVLADPDLGETPTNPGALIRVRREDAGVHVETLLTDGTWAECRRCARWVYVEPDAGLEAVTPEDAATLEAAWPPTNMRAGFAAEAGTALLEQTLGDPPA